jgi:HSP20 family protein
MTDPRPQPETTQRRHRGWFDRQHPFSSLREEIDEVFSHYFSPGNREKTSGGAFELSTSLDMSETKNAINVALDVPGVDEGDIEISLNNGALEISGQREEETEEKDANYHRIERTYGAFRRRIALPCEVEEDKIKAKLKKGVLKITLPKSENAKSNGRKIEISTS